MLNRIKIVLYNWKIKNISIQKIYNYIRFNHKKKEVLNETERRATISLFEYKTLSEPIPYYPFYTVNENNLYGNGKWIFNNLGVTKKNEWDYKIEHGLFLGSIVQAHTLNFFSNNIITFSSYRKNILAQKTDKNIITVGPYIKYAESLYSKKQTRQLKSDLGSVLLIFPSHSIDSVHSDFNINEFIQTISSLASKYDSVLVCLYWKDILLGRFKEYEEQGFKVVTAGHINDYNFLSRLRSIIELSDYTMSNSVGTHVGYCVSLGKPHYIFKQKRDFKLNKLGREELNQRSKSDWDTYYTAVNEIESHFNSYQKEITKEQKNIVNKYWGN